MNYFVLFALLATLATACSAFPQSGSKGYDRRCYSLPISVTQPEFETADFRDCLFRQPCNRNEICCPKRLGGGKCIRLRNFGMAKREAPQQYDSKCYTLPTKLEEPVFETTVFRDCLNKEPCASDELCCPKSVGGGKCIKKVEFEKVETPKYDARCFSAPVIGNGQDVIETLEFRDCLNKEPCSSNQICCPKKTGGGKCVAIPDQVILPGPTV